MSGCVSGVVVFDPVYFTTRFPEFPRTVPALQQYALLFNEAGQYLTNNAASIVYDASPGGRRYILLHLITAHLAKLYVGTSGEAANQLVGRISNATEGSVSVATDMGQQPMAAQFWLQTKYGASFWQMTADLRTGTYVGDCSASSGFLGYVG